MVVPTQKDLHRPVLQMVADTNGLLPLGEVKNRLVTFFKLDDNDLSETVASGQNRFDSRVYWAVSNLRRAGLVESPKKATFICTPEGQAFLAANPGTIEIKDLNELIDFRQRATNDDDDVQPSSIAAKSDEPAAIDLVDATPDEQMEQAFNQSRNKLVDDLLSRIRSESYRDFEVLVLDLLRRMGYGEPEHTGRGGDGGIDGVINQDALGLEKIYVQAKRYTSGSVGEPEIRNFAGSMIARGATKGVFITTGNFSNTARQTAANVSQRNETIRLVDGNELAHLMIRHGVGVVTEYTYEIKKLDENYFAEEI